MIQFPARFRRSAQWVGYPLFALVVFTTTLYATVPRDRVKDRLEAALSADPISAQPLAIGADVTIGDVSLSLLPGPGVKGKDIVLRTRPPNTNDKPARYFVDDLSVWSGLFGILFNRPTYHYKAHALSGVVSGEVSYSPDEARVKTELSGVVVTGVPGIEASVGLPVAGTVAGKADVVAIKGFAAQSNGSIEFSIEDAVIGDGVKKLTVPGDPFLSQGVTFPRLKLGKVAGSIAIEKGKAKLEGWAAHSPDGDVTLEGYVDLRDPISLSQVHAYLKFRPSEALLKREPTVELMNNALGSLGKRADGYLGFQLTGPLSAVFFLPNKEPPPGVGAPRLPSGGVSSTTPVLPPPSGRAGGMTALPPPSAPDRPAPPPPSAAALPPPPPVERPAEKPPERPPPVEKPGQPEEESGGNVPPPPSVRANLNHALEDLNRDPNAPPPPENPPAQ